MSSFKHPVGSESSRVYWRRRAVVGVALLLVVVVIIALIAIATAHAGPGSAAPSASASAGSSSSGSGSGSAASGTGATPTVTAPSVAAPSAGAGTGASGSAGASGSGAVGDPATPSAGGSGSSSGTCTASQITLKPIADQAAYSSLQQPKISMSITNSSSTGCRIDLGSSQQVLTITSGSETYWSSKDCQVNGTHQVITMNAGQTLTTPAITWDRTRSSTTTCNSARSSVPAGGASYHLSVSVGAISSSASALMILN